MRSSHYKKLSAIVDVLESGSRPKGGVSIDSGDIPSLGAEHLNDEGGFNFSKIKKIENIFYEKMRNGKIKYGDILIVKDGATTGKVSFVDHDFPFKKAAVNEHVFILRVDNKISSSKYVFHFLKSPKGKDEILSDFRGATVGGISRGFLDKVNVPLPPLAEQQRIASILDKAVLVKRKRELTIEKLDNLAQSVFNKMFSADIKNSKSKVADFFVINDNKLNIRMNDEELIPFIPMAAVSEITKSVFDIQFRNFKEVKKGYTPIKKGDLIIAKITPCYENGKMALVNEITNDFAFGSTEFHTIRADNLNYLYLLFYYLDSEVIRKGGALNMKGAAGQRRVPAEYFSKLPFCIPNEEQITKFVKTINKIKYERKIHCDSLDSICSFQNSLQSKAFSGQL